MMIYCNLYDEERIKEMISYLQQLPLNIVGILSFVDPWCSQAAKLAEAYGLKAFSGEAMRQMEDKLKTREALRNTVHNPKYIPIPATHRNRYYQAKCLIPAVVKYIDSCGSKDVFFCPDRESLDKNFNQLLKLYPTGTILVEEFLDGPQYIVEVLAFDNKIHIIAIIEQEIKLINNHFIITGYNLMIDPDHDFFNKLYQAVKTILEKFEFKVGPCHLEMRNVKEVWKLVEANPRISGAGMNHMINIGFGVNLVQETIKLATGTPPDITPKHKKPTYGEYLIAKEAGILHKIIGRQEVLNDPNVEYVYIKPRRGKLITPPESLGDRYAYVIATGETPQAARQNAKDAASNINFIYEPLDISINNIIHSQT